MNRRTRRMPQPAKPIDAERLIEQQENLHKREQLSQLMSALDSVYTSSQNVLSRFSLKPELYTQCAQLAQQLVQAYLPLRTFLEQEYAKLCKEAFGFDVDLRGVDDNE